MRIEPRQSVKEHCLEIDRCNQRGGRMLSIVDLLEAGTVTRDLAAYFQAAIGGGASFMVGALPGGAGKTTVMGALLNFVPAGAVLMPAEDAEAIGRAAAQPRRLCMICHEIGPGGYYAYLWGPALRAYFALADMGHILATNLHADTFEQASEQVCRTNGVPPEQFRKMNLLLFLSVRGGRRRVTQVWESDGMQPHRMIWDDDALAGDSALVNADAMDAARRKVESLLAGGVRTIEDVRAQILTNSF